MSGPNLPTLTAYGDAYSIGRTLGKASADALGAVFGEAVGVVAGYRIDPRDQQRADDSGVRILLVDENFWTE